MYRKLGIMLLAELVILVSAGFAQTSSPTPAPVTLQQTQTFGIVGIAANQTARLTVLLPPLPAPFAAAAMCPAQLAFLDDQGNTLKSSSVSIIPGKSVSFDLDRDKDLPTVSGLRTQVRATITTTLQSPIGMLTPTPSPGPPTVVPGSPATPPANPPADTPGKITGIAVAPVMGCSLVPTFEVFDSTTGRTQFVLENTRFSTFALPAATTTGLD